MMGIKTASPTLYLIKGLLHDVIERIDEIGIKLLSANDLVHALSNADAW